MPQVDGRIGQRSAGPAVEQRDVEQQRDAWLVLCDGGPDEFSFDVEGALFLLGREFAAGDGHEGKKFRGNGQGSGGCKRAGDKTAACEK